MSNVVYFQRVKALPDVPVIDTVYFVQPLEDEPASMYVVGDDGVPVPIGSEQGPPGTSVTGSQLNSAGHLILTYSDGSTVDAGYAKGATGATGKGVASVITNNLGHIIVTYSDGTSQDVGIPVVLPFVAHSFNFSKSRNAFYANMQGHLR